MSRLLRVLPPARGAAFAAALGAFSLAAFFSCSQDPESTLGSEGDLIGSHAGDVYQDTISVFADTVIAFNTLIPGSEVDTTLTLGRGNGYQWAIILQPGFADLLEADKSRVVQEASLRLQPVSVPQGIPARFYLQPGQYEEGDSLVASIDTGNPIVDPESGSADRVMEPSNALYPLPPALVQGWIRGESIRTATAVVYNDPVNDRVATFRSREAGTERPILQVIYEGGLKRSYAIRDDAVFIRPLGTTSNLIVSDGYARRVYLRVHLDELPEDAAVHIARLRLHIVPNTLLGDNTTLVVYIPDSTNVRKTGFKNGQLVTEKTIETGDEMVEFTLTNSIFLTLQGKLEDHGFAIRCKDENTELRAVEFYGTDAAEPLRPRVYITSSTPAVFRP